MFGKNKKNAGKRSNNQTSKNRSAEAASEVNTNKSSGSRKTTKNCSR